MRKTKPKTKTKAKTKTKQKHDKNKKKTNDDKNMTFPVFLNSFSYLLKIEFINK